MGMDPVTLGLAVGGAGALAGGLQGAKGTPNQNALSSGSTTSGTQLAPTTQQQSDLQSQSMQSYMNQLQQQQAANAQINPALQYQQAAQGAGQNILNGNAFQISPQQMQQISSIRDALVAPAQGNIQNQLQANLRQIDSNNASNGLRGQAAGQIGANAAAQAANQLSNVYQTANSQAQQQALQLPFQQVAAQSPFIGQGLNYGNNLQQQAIMNSNMEQSPYLLGLLNQNRVAGASHTQQTQGNTSQLGQPGSALGAFAGALGGAGAGVGGALNIYGALNGVGGGGSLGSLSPGPATYAGNLQYQGGGSYATPYGLNMGNIG